ncbi:hypothetical protein CVT25_004873 [Psilocybe cyanescens]|uniref:Uncharacterized protein n=1 Tax=Psilocybe cyanescens TaxID=93625 RepID=A0A409XMV9_PSICY|nr:hypothetical protein CVT25_004873 [Psilocybe cyanescens]
MGVGEALKGLFTSGAGKLANTNRAFYMRSLFLLQACRSLPEVEQYNYRQLEDLMACFNQVEKALKKGISSSKSSKERVDKNFMDANTKLEEYIEKYHIVLSIRGTNEYIKTISFSKATQEDREAFELLQKYSEGLKEEIPMLKRKSHQVLKIILWGHKPIEIGFDESDKAIFKSPNSIFIDTIEIEETASLDILLHRLIEHSTLSNREGNKQLFGKIPLKLYPQFYTEFPRDVTKFLDGDKLDKTFPSIEPWTKVLDSRVRKKILHIILNRGPLNQKDEDRFIKASNSHRIYLPALYTNGWLLSPTENSKFILPDKIAVRQRTPSYSLCLWDISSSPTHIPFPTPQLGSEYDPTSSDVTLLTSSGDVEAHQHRSNSSLGSEITLRDAPRTLPPEAVGPELKITAPNEEVGPELKIPAPNAQLQSSVGYEHASREPGKTSPPAAAQKANTPTSSSRSVDNDQIPSGNAFILKNPITRPDTPASDLSTESPESPELDEYGKPLPGWKPTKHRRQRDAAVEVRLGVAATAEKAKSKGLFARIFRR